MAQIAVYQPLRTSALTAHEPTDIKRIMRIEVEIADVAVEALEKQLLDPQLEVRDVVHGHPRTTTSSPPRPNSANEHLTLLRDSGAHASTT